jgi:hypothetical protein
VRLRRRLRSATSMRFFDEVLLATGGRTLDQRR